LKSNGIAATPEKRSLRGIANQIEIFEYPEPEPGVFRFAET